MSDSSQKERALQFLRLVTSGKIAEAYDTYVSPDFRHHNPYYKSDAASLRKGMEESDLEFPNKTFEVQRAAVEGDIVMVHSCVKLSDERPDMSVVHIFRFENGKIVELWDTAQPVPDDMINELGMF